MLRLTCAMTELYWIAWGGWARWYGFRSRRGAGSWKCAGAHRNRTRLSNGTFYLAGTYISSSILKSDQLPEAAVTKLSARRARRGAPHSAVPLVFKEVPAQARQAADSHIIACFMTRTFLHLPALSLEISIRRHCMLHESPWRITASASEQQCCLCASARPRRAVCRARTGRFLS